MAIRRLDGGGPPRWHLRDKIIAEVRRVNRRYSADTDRRILLYDLVGRTTFNHVASSVVERRVKSSASGEELVRSSVATGEASAPRQREPHAESMIDIAVVMVRSTAH